MEFDGNKSESVSHRSNREPVSSASESAGDSGEQGGASKENTWIGIRIKKGFGFAQWIGLLLLPCGTMIVGVYLNT